MTAAERIRDDGSMQAEIAEEEAALALLKSLIDDVARAAERFWFFGDGYGGYVRLLLEEAFDRMGLARYVAAPKLDARRAIPTDKRAMVFARDGLRCQECGSGKELTVDHIVPVRSGGGDELENLRTLCRSCNSKKGAR